MQLADFSSTCTWPVSFLANYETLLLLLFGFLSMYCSTACFEDIGLVTIVTLFTKWIKSVKSGSLLYLLCIVKTFLDHLSLTLPDNLDSNMLLMSGVSNTFKLQRWPIFSTFTKNFGISDMHQHRQLWFGASVCFPFYRLLLFCKDHHFSQWVITW